MGEKFEELRGSRTRGFVPFITAGDPDLDASLSIVECLAEEGADIIELGVPFSDPIADGPVIQASSQRALANGTSLRDVLDLAGSFRSRHDTPLVLFSYLNPLLQFGLAGLRDECAKNGIDGILVTDVVDHEAEALRALFAEKNIDLISLVAPTTSDIRLKQICDSARGFIYAVSRAGVTGTQTSVSNEAEKLVRRVRRYTDTPVAVGFGISTHTQIESIWKYADAGVVGSAIVAEVADAVHSRDPAAGVRRFVRALCPGLQKNQPESKVYLLRDAVNSKLC